MPDDQISFLFPNTIFGQEKETISVSVGNLSSTEFQDRTDSTHLYILTMTSLSLYNCQESNYQSNRLLIISLFFHVLCFIKVIQTIIVTYT